jgi:hypothetical protein
MGTPQDKRELREALAQLEQDSTSVISLLRAAQSLRDIAKGCRESGALEKARELLWESEALMLAVDGEFLRPEAREYLDGRIKEVGKNPLWQARLQRALVSLNSDYETNMAYAGFCEQVIAYFREGDSLPTDILQHSFASNFQKDWQEVVQCYQQAMNVYLQFNQDDKARTLLASLFHLAQMCDESASSLALQLLLVLVPSFNRLEQSAPGFRDQLKVVLRRAINHKKLEHELDFSLLALARSDEHRSALELLRDLADDEQERHAVDVELCQTMELAAQACLKRGHIDGSEMWYRQAAKIAQDRLGDAEWAGQLLETASRIPLLRTLRPPTELDKIVLRATEERHSERFLLLPEQFLAEYDSVDDKLTRVLNDDRLLLDKAAVEARAAQYRGKGLLGLLSNGRFTDERGNPRGDYPMEAPFIEQYIREVTGIIGTLFSGWQESEELAEQHIVALLERNVPGYDRTIFEAGLSYHFQADYIASVHVLIPRFEDVVTWCAREAGVPTKRLKEGRPGEALLCKILHPDNAGMSTLLGENLLELAWWYMCNSAGPFNWRNRVAHGWVSPSECNAEVSAMTIYLTLRVIRKAREHSVA